MKSKLSTDILLRVNYRGIEHQAFVVLRDGG